MKKLNQNKKANEEEVTVRCVFDEGHDLTFFLTLILAGLIDKQTHLLMVSSAPSSFVLQPTTHYNISDIDEILNFVGDLAYLLEEDENKGTITITSQELEEEKIYFEYDFDALYIEIQLNKLAYLLSCATGKALKNIACRTGYINYTLASSENYKFFISAANASHLRLELFEREFVNEKTSISDNILKIIDKCNIFRNHKEISEITIYLENTRDTEDFFASSSTSSFKLKVVEPTE